MDDNIITRMITDVHGRPWMIILSQGKLRMSTDAMDDNIITRKITDVHGREEK